MTDENVQGTEFWKQLRCGLVTGSRCADVIASLKRGGESAERRRYREELIAERLTGIPIEQYVSKEMQWGIDQEPFARAAYELERDVLVETTGFVLHPEIARFGASPDGLVNSDGIIQIKCPNTTTHLVWMLGKVVPVEHAPQMLAEMACTGRAWCDFVSFDPRLPAHLQLFIRRFERDEQLIAALEAEVQHFNEEIEETLSRLPQGVPAIVRALDHTDGEEMEF